MRTGYWVAWGPCHPVAPTPKACSGQLAGGPSNEGPLIPPEKLLPFLCSQSGAGCFHGDKSSKSCQPFCPPPPQSEGSLLQLQEQGMGSPRAKPS